jgi:Ca-activated chloride channel homolog
MKQNSLIPVRMYPVLMVFLLLITGYSYAQVQEEEDKTCSPFFFVKSEDGGVDQLPLKSTTADVSISGVIADVTVRQTYCNTGEIPLEAIYIFPASTKAAVYSMQMQVGNRILKAEIREAEQAREEYEQAKNEGKTTSLLEQQRPNVFQMNVANILPGDTIQIEMRYTELITPVDGIYEFVYPTVVGPRYAELSHEEDSSWVEIPYMHEGESPTYDFDITVDIQAGMKIQSLESPSHENLTIVYPTESSARCTLPESENKSGNKDFILHYGLSGDQIESGLLLYEGEEEKFFLAMIQPPKSPQPNDIPPREYVFIMDVSGSMNGFPISVSKTLLIDLISSLHPDDKFNVICFAGGAQVLSDKSLDATQENIDKAIDVINNKVGGGGTNLLHALNTALALQGTEEYARTFIIATDGYVTVEKEAYRLIRNSLSEANFFSFGIGSSVNRYLIECIAHAGMGEPFVVTNQEEAIVAAEKFRKYIESPVLTNIHVSYDGFNVYDVEPHTIPDVFAQRPILIFGKWENNPQGVIEMEGLSGYHSWSGNLYVNQYSPSDDNSALRYLWARKKIQILDDYGQLNQYGETDEAIKEEITELGLRYHLLTRYTSFIAIDSLIRNEGDTSVTVTQPLPLPSGVSDLAVGGNTTGYAGYNMMAFEVDRFGVETETPEYKSYIDKIYPNPFTSEVKIWIFVDDVDFSSHLTLVLCDHTGRTIKTMEVNHTIDNYFRVKLGFEDLGNLPPGMYRLSLMVNGKITDSESIVKK